MSELTLEIGLAVAPDGTWHVFEQGDRDRLLENSPHGSFAERVAEKAADFLGIGAQLVIVTVCVPKPEIVRVRATLNGSTNGNHSAISNRAETREAGPATIDSSRGGATSREQGGGV